MEVETSGLCNEKMHNPQKKKMHMSFIYTYQLLVIVHGLKTRLLPSNPKTERVHAPVLASFDSHDTLKRYSRKFAFKRGGTFAEKQSRSTAPSSTRAHIHTTRTQGGNASVCKAAIFFFTISSRSNIYSLKAS
jgi:hypothetical protein